MFGYIIVSSPPPLHNQTNFPCTKTKDGQPSFFVAPKLPNTQTRPLQKQVFPCTLICFATQLHLHCLVQKKPHSINSLYGFYSTCCNLKVSVFQNFCNLVAFACVQKFACAFRVFACTSSFAVNTAFARNPCSFWRAATVPQRLLGRVRPHRP